MELSYALIIAGSLIVTAVVFVAVGTLYSRSRMLPMCWSCGAWKLAPTRQFLHRDLIPMLLMLQPVRCVGCFKRYYTIRGVKPQRRRPAWHAQDKPLRYIDDTSTALAVLDALFSAPKARAKQTRKEIQPAQKTSVVAQTPAQSTSNLNALLDALKVESGPAVEAAQQTSAATQAGTRG